MPNLDRRRFAGALALAFLLPITRFPASAQEAAPISDVEWTAEEVAGISDLGDTPPTLTILHDGRASGHGGCNRYFATTSINGEEISFSEIGSTFMACDAPMMEIEQVFFAALASTVSYRIEGGRLLLLDADGQVAAALSASV